MSPLAVTHGHIRGDIKTPLLDVTHSHPISISIDNQSVESMSEEESNEEQVRLERLLSYGVTPENAEIAITEYMDEESSDRLTAVIALERMAKINHDAKKRNERMRRFR